MRSVLYGRHLTLVALTVTTQAAAGLAVFKVLRLLAGHGAGGVADLVLLFMLAFSGAVVSVFHLGHPQKMATAFMNLRSSWLSREGLLLSLFLGVSFFQMVLGLSHGLFFSSCLALVGIGFLFTQGMVYVVPGFSAMRHGAPVVLFFFSSLTTGICLSAWFGDAAWRELLARIGSMVFASGFVGGLMLPLIWKSGTVVVSDTARAWGRSPLYYLWMGLGYGFPLLIVFSLKTLPVWLCLFVSVAECTGRILFFTQTRHTSDYIGHL
ncbi:MAG: dimethyl sulfoxide reductase anchor subunit [Desulfobacterales bacterium]|nr:dimethyl sulfoxide reductase anchor subunit [Desulfobacterales bacterium]